MSDSFVLNLDAITNGIEQLDGALKQSANRAINRHLTVRNWLIGYYIIQYEQHGEDRAKYGQKTTVALAKKLNNKGFSQRTLELYRLFYSMYPALNEPIRAFMSENISQSVIAKMTTLALPMTLPASSDSTPSQISQTLSAKSANDLALAPEKLLNKLNFSHFALLVSIESPLKRLFYEVECIKGTWSVRELKRQISSLYYERSGYSEQPEKLSDLTHRAIAKSDKHPAITKDVYAFEFLGLPEHLAVEEEDLETALLNHLQQFILEMGYGFCLEGRQKRILIGDEYFFVDLVLYHRILKCHVLVELKVGEFFHENAGQLNAYLNYYRKEVMEQDDNPPVGLLLVTDRNEALVQYATAGMDEQLFVKQVAGRMAA
jgi:predicted nuclease of restriction endonuclease-like (RecB) superfamily